MTTAVQQPETPVEPELAGGKSYTAAWDQMDAALGRLLLNASATAPRGVPFFPSSTPQAIYPQDALIYQDIFAARDQEIIRRLGSGSYDDATYHPGNPWYQRTMIRYGGNNEEDGVGAEVTIPEGYDTVWARVMGEGYWTVISGYFLDGAKEQTGRWVGGYRHTNCYTPDGALTDSHSNRHQWLPIPAGRSGRFALTPKDKTSGDFWLSGIAFSKNPWHHATQSALGFHHAINGGNETGWNTHNWNNDALAQINSGTHQVLKVPVVPSGRDKLLYLIEHNNDWNGAMHNYVQVNGERIERFRATYDNPFARHWNSKFYERYIAARVPEELIPGDARFLDVIVDMTKQNNHIHFREIGAHDLALQE